MKELTPMEAAALVFGIEIPEPPTEEEIEARAQELAERINYDPKKDEKLQKALDNLRDLLSKPII